MEKLFLKSKVQSSIHLRLFTYYYDSKTAKLIVNRLKLMAIIDKLEGGAMVVKVAKEYKCGDYLGQYRFIYLNVFPIVNNLILN